ncbi:MAG: serine/threonine protein kinase, partial [Mycobacteriaceae bacterium]|nr:serine/threonine protein kinase [Mycobacteriaceae bacterium]
MSIGPGSELNERYEIGHQLGSGGMATVYLAYDKVLDREVAVKVLSDRFAEDPAFVERFRREASAAAGLNHPNIVAVYDRG